MSTMRSWRSSERHGKHLAALLRPSNYAGHSVIAGVPCANCKQKTLQLITVEVLRSSGWLKDICLRCWTLRTSARYLTKPERHSLRLFRWYGDLDDSTVGPRHGRYKVTAESGRARWQTYIDPSLY